MLRHCTHVVRSFLSGACCSVALTQDLLLLVFICIRFYFRGVDITGSTAVQRCYTWRPPTPSMNANPSGAIIVHPHGPRTPLCFHCKHHVCTELSARKNVPTSSKHLKHCFWRSPDVLFWETFTKMEAQCNISTTILDQHNDRNVRWFSTQYARVAQLLTIYLVCKLGLEYCQIIP